MSTPVSTSDLPQMIQALTTSSAQQALIALGFDYVIHQPLRTWIHPKDLVRQAVALFEPNHAGELIHQHLPQALERLQNRADQLGETIKDWLTAEADMELRSASMRPIQLSPSQLQSWVQHDLTAHVMGEFVQEILDQFIQTAKPGGQGGGLVGMASRGALGFASKLASRASQGVGGAMGGVLQGMGDQVEAHLKSLVGDFIQSSMQGLLERLAIILSTPDAALKLGAARLELYEMLLKQPLGALVRQTEDVEFGEWAKLIPELIAFNLNRAAVQEAFLIEAELMLNEHGDRPLRSFLGSDEQVTQLKQELIHTLSSPLAHFIESEGFVTWVKTFTTDL